MHWTDADLICEGHATAAKEPAVIHEIPEGPPEVVGETWKKKKII